MTTLFESVLVANRGEIAVRVIRTLRRLGVRSIAVHSDADAGARHVREADTAVRIGPAPAAESYLAVENLLAAARRAGAQAVHPGYGFLSENAEFARACAAAGLVFVGPPAEAIELMGDKIRAKETVRAAGVPVVPGSSGAGLDDAELAAAARELGMPVLLKPSAGGGGKGMRLVRDAESLAEELAAARRTARGAFGDDTLLVERWIDQPRHVEVQVLADGHGGVLHLGERECSLQRRHQKVVEEAPSPLLDEVTRAAMGEEAVRAARSCGYRGAGTVEFIVPGAEAPRREGDPLPFFFMEMNTRLQVEHPVTELVTGLDLVEWQLRVAAGEPLPFDQRDITLTGHAVEARIYAESARVTDAPATGAPAGDGAGERPARRVDFLPSAGTVTLLREPAGEGVRVDSGLDAGTEIGTRYDPMLAKIVAHGPDRATALRRLRAALAETTVLGVETNTGFLRRLLAHPDVVSGSLDTGLVDREAAALLPQGVPEEVYAAAALLRQAALAPPTPGGAGRWVDPFSVPSGWRLGDAPAWTVHRVRAAGREPVAVAVRGPAEDAEVRVGDGPPVRARLTVAPDGDSAPADPAPRDAAPAAAVPAGRATLEWQGLTLHFDQAPLTGEGGHWLARDGESWRLADHDPVAATLREAVTAHGADALTAPMPGTVTVVKAAVGDRVSAGQSVLVVEAMKMEHVLTAPHDGTLSQLEVTAGSTVAMDQVLAVVEPEAPATPEPSPAATASDSAPNAAPNAASDTAPPPSADGSAPAAPGGHR